MKKLDTSRKILYLKTICQNKNFKKDSTLECIDD